ncbi:MAG: TonB-dependent receptor [Bacteroidia bacterium]|nr:TonB-dependent receptor [Bacteroidia bacterium]
MRKLLLSLIFGFITLFAFAQKGKVTGYVTDKKTKEPLIGATILVKGAAIGTTTEANGSFALELDFSKPVVLQVSYIGYEKLEVPVSGPGKALTIEMEMAIIPGKEVVVTSSRLSETILQAPVSIHKMNEKEIKEVTSGDFYQGLSNIQGVDIATSSMGFKAINMRGFNTSAPVRVVQMVDGMDNQAPGLNFAIGNLVGANDLDLQSVEVITGPASALYGPNAMQGVVSMKTKSPFDYQGLSLQLKGGSRNMAEGQFRYAKVIGKNKKFAFKVTGSFMRADDWRATDTTVNKYGKLNVTQNLASILEKQQYDTINNTPQEVQDFIALNNYLNFNPVTYQGLNQREIRTPGYMETDLAKTNVNSIKVGVNLSYKIKPDMILSYDYKLGNGTAIYQGTNRYSINNILFQQHKIEFQSKRLLVRAYTTFENAGDSYDIVFTGINLSKEGIKRWVSKYISAYVDTLRPLTNDFDDNASVEDVEKATAYATQVAYQEAFYQPGTSEFETLRNSIVSSGNLQKGSKFIDNSSIQHLDLQYSLPINFMEAMVGGSFRRYGPQSYGTIFTDTLINSADTLPDGAPDTKAKFTRINNYEYGAFLQLSKSFFDKKLKLMASGRVDKNTNFKPQFSPRFAIMWTTKSGHVFRVSAQQAFRMPTLQNQYIGLDLGPIYLPGNLNGYNNLYTLESVKAFQAQYDSTDANGNYIGSIQPSLLQPIQLKPLRPEQIQTVEAGYRGIWFKRLYVDLSGYVSRYRGFIGNIRVVEPLHGAVAGEESGVDAILTNTSANKTYQVYQIAVNADQDVMTYGGSIGLAYYLTNKYVFSANYTFASLDDSKLTDPILPGFNTAKHKVNAGIKGRKVIKNFGFGVNWQWVDTYLWQSSFGDGQVAAYNLVDVQVNYEFPKYFSTIRLGASNILNNLHKEIYGGPYIGRMFYAQWTFDIPDL